MSMLAQCDCPGMTELETAVVAARVQVLESAALVEEVAETPPGPERYERFGKAFERDTMTRTGLEPGLTGWGRTASEQYLRQAFVHCLVGMLQPGCEKLRIVLGRESAEAVGSELKMAFAEWRVE